MTRMFDGGRLIITLWTLIKQNNQCIYLILEVSETVNPKRKAQVFLINLFYF